ncbi:MAG: hypothetical protein DI562_03975 [Stenotrophomonas acidaminiphila]|nr:MAG: hypothetical protein DI562_03975 [Stenotrophomonas acidaminiphila]
MAFSTCACRASAGRAVAGTVRDADAAAGCAATGAGSALRSTLPFGSSGIAGNRTKCCGTM